MVGVEFLKAREGKLYLITPDGEKRVGQIILQHGEEGDEPFSIYNASLDRDELINKLLIGKKDFERIIRSGKTWPLLNIPLYSKSYYTGIPFENVRKKPIDFDFIQIQGRALIYADGDTVRKVGTIDGLASYLLVKSGLIISPEVIISAIEYSAENNLPLPDVNHPLVRAYKLLKGSNPDVRFDSIRKEKDFYTIKTSIGYIHFDGRRLSNTIRGFNLLRQLPVKEGYLESVGEGYILHDFILDEGAVVDFTIAEDGRVELFLKEWPNVKLNAKVSLKDGIIASTRKQKIKFAKEYRHLGVSHFFVEGDNVKAESIIEVSGERYRVTEDAKVFEMTDTLKVKGKLNVPFGEVISRSELISKLNFTGENVKVAFFNLHNRSFVVVYGNGEVGIKGVIDRSGQHLLISDGLSTRVYRVIVLDDFTGSFKVSGKPEGIEELVRLMELNLVSKIYSVVMKVELGNDVFITVKSRAGEATVSYSREAFIMLKPTLKLGSVRVGISNVPLPTDAEGVRVYSIAFEQSQEVVWVVGRPLGVPEARLVRKYVFWNGVFSYAKKKIRPINAPERASKEVCFSDLFGRTLCIPVSSQMTLF